MPKPQTILISFLVVTVVLLIMISILFEITGFSNIFGNMKQESMDLPLSIEYSSIDIQHSNNLQQQQLSSSQEPESLKNQQSQDWFDSTKWLDTECPYFENVCVYNQKFRVFNKEDQFNLHHFESSHQLFGTNMPNSAASQYIYGKMFNTSLWDKQEYESASCHYSDRFNHLIIGSQYQTMLGEWYVRTLSHLFQLYNYSNSTPSQYIFNNDVELYLFIGDQTELLMSHHLFIQPFTKYTLQHFTNLFERITCQCYHRLIFCGFNKIINNDKLYLMHKARVIDQRQEWENAQIFPEMIRFYNDYVNRMDINIHRDILKWKRKILAEYLSFTEIDMNMDEEDISKWKFIGFYQRFVRRKWKNLKSVIIQCNGKYFVEHKTVCITINLESHLHPRDVIIMHRACDMLIGIHGAHLTDAIWMYDPQDYKQKNRYIIELLPAHARYWASSLTEPTALGVIFWGSTFNHIGMKLTNDSLDKEALSKGPGFWFLHDFKLDFRKLTLLIDYLMIKGDEGYCNENNDIHAKDITLDKKFERKGIEIAIYNAYCANSGDDEVTWNYVYPHKLETCDTCSYLNGTRIPNAG